MYYYNFCNYHSLRNKEKQNESIVSISVLASIE